MSYIVKDSQLPRYVDVPGMVERVDDRHPDYLELHERYTLQRHGMLLRDDLAWAEYWRWDTDDITWRSTTTPTTSPRGTSCTCWRRTCSRSRSSCT